MTRHRSRGRARLLAAGSALMGAIVLTAWLGACCALAAPVWRLGSNAAPSYLPPGGEARIIASAANLGDMPVTPSSSHPLGISDTLPSGLEVPQGAIIEGSIDIPGSPEQPLSECSLQGASRKQVSCTTTQADQQLAPYHELKLIIPVRVASGALTGEQNTVSASGGETSTGELPPAEPLRQALTVKNQTTPFGVENYQLTPENEDGTPDTRAGSHPFQLTTTLDLNETLAPESEAQPALEPSAPALARDLTFQLPPGLLGNPQALPRCSDAQFSSIGEDNVNACPANTAIGVALITLNLPSPPLRVFSEAVPVFNLEPAPGEPARFGMEDTKVPIILDTSIRTGGDYGVDVTIGNTSQAAQLLASQVSLWGEPQDPTHDPSRGWACLRDSEVNGETCTPPVQPTSIPFLTLPTSCLGGLATDMQTRAWSGAQAEAGFSLQNALGEPLASLQGCETVPFNPTISIEPADQQEGHAPEATVTSASTPTGLNVNVSLPAEKHALGESAVRGTTVTLPAGVQLNPSAANGLQACSESQIGYEGPGNSQDPFSPGAGEPLRFSSEPAACPEASKVGLVRIHSPDLSHELEGGAYIAEQTNNPFGSLFAIYIVAEDPTLGVRVKLAGEVSLNEATGQITSTFANTPQVPFESLSLRFFEGPRASLSTPALCGTYTMLASFTPWSSATPLTREASLPITGGPEGGGCADPLPFAPRLKAGSASAQAGAFTSFSLTLGEPDADQRLAALSVHLPAGIAAILASLTPCPEPQAAHEQCGPESLIGQSLASAGFGSEPYELPGRVYLTGPYEGAPFGIEVVTPAVAGPFNLGSVTVRSRIEIDAHTAAVTITTDPIPTIVRGVPVDLKQINVQVNRPDFEYNPTNCQPMSIEGSLTGAAGASAEVASPFQVSGCQKLSFRPGVTAAAQGKTSKADGANLRLEFTSRPGEAHVAKTILTIPAILPARLTTIQKACIASVFEANPATCPEGSDIGTALVHTPVLKNPLTGPIYLVSHGNAAWPDAELVLQGEGIKVILDGQTAIKKGVTTSSFLAVPDAPFETVEATLPEGPHSALTTNLPLKDHYSLCGQRLAIPSALTGQNGTAVNENVKVKLEGCHAGKASKIETLTRKQELARALKACRKARAYTRSRRTACQRRARERY